MRHIVEAAVDAQAHEEQGRENLPLLVRLAHLFIGVLAIQHLEDGGVPIRGRYHPPGAHLRAILQPDAHRPVILHQDLLHLAAVMELPAQVRVALFQRPRHGHRAANRVAGVLVVQVGQGKNDEKHRKFREPRFAYHPADERIFEALGELQGAGLQQLLDTLALACHQHAQLEALDRTLQRRISLERLGLVKGNAQADALDEFLGHLGILRRKLQHVLLQPVYVTIKHKGAPISPLEAGELIAVDELPLLRDPHLLPVAVHGALRRGADQPVNAAVNGIALALPGRAQPARQVAHLEDLALVAVHLGIDARRQPGKARPDDDDAFIVHTALR